MVLGLTCSSLTFSQGARAEGDGQATAETLFQRGKAAMTAGDNATACPLFAESYRLDPAGGTLQNLAFCYEALGKFGSAYARYQDLIALSQRANPPRLDRVKLAQEHIEKLEPQLTRLGITTAGAESGLVVSIDQVEYRQVSWQSGIVLDTGAHEIVASAPGKKPWKTTVTMSARGDSRLTIPKLEDVPRASEPSPSVDPHPYRRVGTILGAAGLVTVGVGATMGVLAAGAKPGDCVGTGVGYNPQDGNKCIAGSEPYHDYQNALSRAHGFATAANVLIPVGAALTGVGLYLFLKGGDAQGKARVGLLAAPGGAFVTGSFQ